MLKALSCIYLACSTGEKTTFVDTQSYTKLTLPLYMVLPLVATVSPSRIRHRVEIIVCIIRV